MLLECICTSKIQLCLTSQSRATLFLKFLHINTNIGLSPVGISTVCTEGIGPHREEVGEIVVQACRRECVLNMLWKKCVHERHTKEKACSLPMAQDRCSLHQVDILHQV